ncbi:MAG: hypothetical protein AABW64_01830 [Nanoarchaeota archaeon]|mgnify:CR=1
MKQVTLQQLQKTMLEVKDDVQEIRDLLEENRRPSVEVLRDIGASRKRPRSQMIPHEEMVKEFLS